MTNFDFLKSDPRFTSFAEVAGNAEKILHIDLAASALNCRRALELAVKWMYSVDADLRMPYQDTLAVLISTREFRDLVDDSLMARIDYIRRIGNQAAHGDRRLDLKKVELCIENLFYFMDFVACCYDRHYQEPHFDPGLLRLTTEEALSFVTEKTVDLQQLMEENQALRDELTATRAEQRQTYNPKPLDATEYETRKLYIDAMLEDAGWIEGKDWQNEVELGGMPNHSAVGFADYVLYGDDGRPLAVIEAKKTCKDPAVGRQQAALYANLLEEKYGRRPVIFLTNGFDTRIEDNVYPERRVAAFYSKRDLEKLFNLQTIRTSLKNVDVDKNIAGRYYQDAAVKAVCNSLEENRRKALVVMATGSGKTRTVIALCKVLLNHSWVKNILFLADRNSLVTQAKRSFVNLLPDLSVTNLCEDKENYSAHCVFSTYQTMMNCIDNIKDEQGKLFTCDDELHRQHQGRTGQAVHLRSF